MCFLVSTQVATAVKPPSTQLTLVLFLVAMQLHMHGQVALLIELSATHFAHKLIMLYTAMGVHVRMRFQHFLANELVHTHVALKSSLHF